MHLTSSSIDWYAARAGGVVAYLLLTAGVLLGITMSGRKRLDRWPRFALEDVHRFTGILVGAFLVLHVGAIAIDAYMPFTLASLVVPLVSAYRAIWTALGIVALELLIALAIANRLRDRLGYRFWRRSHYLNFLVWSAATLHGLGSGTDRSTPWLVAIMLGAAASVTGATVWRVLRSRPARTAGSAVPVGAAGLAACAVLGLVLGPLARHHRRVVDAAVFSDRLTGQLVRNTGVTRGLISLAGTGSGHQRILLRADLLFAPEQLLSTSFQMEYLPSGSLCRGAITHVRNYGFDAACRLPNGERRVVHAQWRPSNGVAIAGGHVSARAA